ncbi:gamma-glutamyl-gamma-aminobutyrate hydrolase family protein [Limnoglobus roseus]|uniref:gamma-glutamyl-gamma-aminobutyrate hydrolase n=1 Tax=Limnoglobus roseus TaxID=2598579 RepID=A0A5C1APR5_9BACT|nr:gamma-glutamyl-gamma-aminobutyrate hydrolase family protein [Limnoglobus roseus]QEL20006.1 gamma-glutamyl-gamma-aminobutyrate hydrolase family protein [Limnoglobus roseus]
MAKRPVIGIVMQSQSAIPGERPAAWLMSQRYIEVLESFGAVPWLIPLLTNDSDTLREIFERLDGLFLAGGADIEPSRYGEATRPVCGGTDANRDAVEISLIRQALESRTPIFGICRGLQILNVACGGSLYQDIATQVPAAIKHDFTAAQQHLDRTAQVHDVTVKAGSRLADLLGSAVLPVNSIHHQAVKDLGKDLIATAFSPDGVIEGVEGTTGGYVLAVQWHPEELVETTPAMRRLFSDFVTAAAEHRGD